MSTRLVERASSALGGRLGRRNFLVRAAMAGSAVAAAGTDYVLRPTTAYAAICNCRGQGCPCGSRCCEGWTAFCCTLPGGENRCPDGTFAAGWWKADGSRFCAGPRYYVDCNAHCRCTTCSGGFCPHCDGHACACGNGDCNNWGAACNVFRYGQCHQEIGCAGRIVCRVVSCTPPWEIDATCTTASATANETRNHDAACLHPPPAAQRAASSAMASTPSGDGYYVLDDVGGVFTFGDARFKGSVPQLRQQGHAIPEVPTAAITPAPVGDGYWVLDQVGGVFAFGSARFHGSVPGLRGQGHAIPVVPTVALTASPSGDGYWVLDDAGGVFAFGDAPFHGSIPWLRSRGHAIPVVPVADMTTDPSGDGYWVLDSAGGIFTFGSARFYGSVPGLTGPSRPTAQVRAVAIATTPSGRGYWVLDEAGGVFAFGDARFHGSVPWLRNRRPEIGVVRVIDLAPTPSGAGYWILDETGGIFAFGDAEFLGRP